ncbi:hypothetical protein PRIO_0608 [Paenibacillus riograndensis SBR5]|uniref:Uncharacterized protein n=1 Tax=Paenibacillus riograndensis SBR5 TaxID=1073571 RepID=A0A0E4CUF6_9BACL|nr:hypothetical protein PRIO_0608 [Paenibacillus riograndensis SBR5]
MVHLYITAERFCNQCAMKLCMIIKDTGMRSQYRALDCRVPDIHRSSFIEIEQDFAGFASPELKIGNFHSASAHINNDGGITCYVELQPVGVSQISSGQMNDIIGIRSVNRHFSIFFYKRLCLRQCGQFIRTPDQKLFLGRKINRRPLAGGLLEIRPCGAYSASVYSCPIYSSVC